MALFCHSHLDWGWNETIQDCKKRTAPDSRGEGWKKRKNHGSKGQGPVEDEEETITLNKKPVAAEEVIEGTSFADQKVAFPPIAEVPSLESLSKKSIPLLTGRLRRRIPLR